MLLILLLLIPLMGVFFIFGVSSTHMFLDFFTSVSLCFNLFYSFAYHLIYTLNAIPIDETAIGTLIVSIANLANERGEQLIGIANAAEDEIRDNFVANGLRPGESLQPYATNLANYLDQLRNRNGHSEIPENFLTPGDTAFIKHIIPDAVLDYNPKRHLGNTVNVRRFFKNLR